MLEPNAYWHLSENRNKTHKLKALMWYKHADLRISHLKLLHAKCKDEGSREQENQSYDFIKVVLRGTLKSEIPVKY